MKVGRLMSRKHLVLQSDFGLDDGAVAAMYGVAYSVAPNITISNLTHGINPYNVFDGSYRLIQTVNYWPEGTVFVSVVDPGVGTDRQSVVAKLKSGHYIVTPNNGTLSHVHKYIGLESLKEIDETVNRLAHSEGSHTFHGRDIYVYNGALLAEDETYYDQLKAIPLNSLESLELLDPNSDGQTRIEGVIDIFDIRFGSLWTNIPARLLKELSIQSGDQVKVTIEHDGVQRYQNYMRFGHSFADVQVGEPIAYINSLLHLGIAINQKSFSETYNIGRGNDWLILIEKVGK